MDKSTKKEVREIMSDNLPEKKFRAGAVSATIWENEAKTDSGVATFNTVSLQRSYKDKNGQWQNTGTLRINDIPKAVLVLRKAYEYLALNDDSIDED